MQAVLYSPGSFLYQRAAVHTGRRKCRLLCYASFSHHISPGTYWIQNQRALTDLIIHYYGLNEKNFYGTNGINFTGEYKKILMKL
jgi:hypothetical protein